MQNYLEYNRQPLAASQMPDNTRLEQTIHVNDLENVQNTMKNYIKSCTPYDFHQCYV